MNVNMKFYDYPGEYVNSDEGTHYARTHIEELHAQYEQVQGNSIVRGLTCGGLFKLSEYPREDKSGIFALFNYSQHSNAGFEAGVGGGTNYTNSFTAIDINSFRPARITLNLLSRVLKQRLLLVRQVTRFTPTSMAG